MKRRDFLKSPAVTLLVPAAAGFPLTRALALGESPDTSPVAEKARKHPQHLHADFSTYQPGIEYFYLGNGDIQAAVQYAPDRTAENPQTFVGLTLMDAERFSRKWSTYLFHPERGLENSRLYVLVGATVYYLTPECLVDVAWKIVESVPVVSLQWKAGDLAIEEELYVPSEGAYLVRQIRVRNTGSQPIPFTLKLQLVPNFTLFDDVAPDFKANTVAGLGYSEVKLYCLDGEVKASGRYDLISTPKPLAPGGESLVRYVYAIRKGTPVPRAKEMPARWKNTVAYWKSKPVLAAGNDRLDAMYRVSRNGLKALLAHSGKRDGGYWQYNMEWVRDDVMMIQAMSMAGFHEEARALLTKNLTKNVSADGCMVESSRWSGYDYTELDQNGQIVYGSWLYLCWTGDRELIRKYWPQIVRAGDYPLQDVFRGNKARLLKNKREFWERDDRFGVEEGFELTYQFWVMYGLEKGSELARVLGDDATASRWTTAAKELRAVIFEDPTYRFIENGRVIKRRTLDGKWQQYMVPTDRKMMPPGSPMALNAMPECEPDSSNLYPIIYGYLDPRGDVARNTLQWMDVLWNQQWTHGGFARYNTTSEPDPPGPWPIASLLVARAAIESGDDERAWRAIDWVATIHGSKSGGWFERYAPSITPPAPPVSVVGWAWAEVVLMMVQHLMGFRPNLKNIVIRPRLIKGVDTLQSVFNVQGASFDVTVKRAAQPKAWINGKEITLEDGSLVLPHQKKGSRSAIVLEVVGR
jgi:hypothetical protein